MKTEKSSFVPYIVDMITAETEKFFFENFSCNIESDYLGGKQSGITASLFSVCAFRCAAQDRKPDAVPAPKRADEAAKYLSLQPHIAACGRVQSENGYINIYFSDEYLYNGIEYYSKQFDILFEKDVFAKYSYGRQAEACGIRRYCINRVISVCEMPVGKYGNAGSLSADFTGNIQRELAEHCIFAVGSRNISSQCAKKLSEFTAQLFYEADSCIKNASMIYLKLYKACAYVLHTLITEEGKN